MRREMMIGRISRRFSERSGNSACLLVYYRFVFLEELKSMLLSVIFLIFISLGLPDSLLGSGWPIMQKAFAVPSSYAGYVSMSISFMTTVDCHRVHPAYRDRSDRIFVFNIVLDAVFVRCALRPWGRRDRRIGQPLCREPLFFGGHEFSALLLWRRCCDQPEYHGAGPAVRGLGAGLPLDGLQCILSLPLWKNHGSAAGEGAEAGAGIRESVKVPGVIPTLIAFFAYCSGEATCFLWTSSYFAGAKTGLTNGMIASFGSLIFDVRKTPFGDYVEPSGRQTADPDRNFS